MEEGTLCLWEVVWGSIDEDKNVCLNADSSHVVATTHSQAIEKASQFISNSDVLRFFVTKVAAVQAIDAP